MTQSRSAEALFMAYANAEEAARTARAITPAQPISLDDLSEALRLINTITKQLGITVRAYSRALANSRHHQPPVLSASTYHAARELHQLASRLRGAPIDNSLSALTELQNHQDRNR